MLKTREYRHIFAASQVSKEEIHLTCEFSQNKLFLNEEFYYEGKINSQATSRASCAVPSSLQLTLQSPNSAGSVPSQLWRRGPQGRGQHPGGMDARASAVTHGHFVRPKADQRKMLILFGQLEKEGKFTNNYL